MASNDEFDLEIDQELIERGFAKVHAHTAHLVRNLPDMKGYSRSVYWHYITFPDQSKME